MDIIIVDDNNTFKEGLKDFIETGLGYTVTATFEDGEQFLKNTEYHKADIILMDIEMPNINGIEATKQALWKWDYLKVIAITNYQTKAYLIELVSAGFKACVFKNSVFNELDKAIDKVCKGALYYPPTISIKNGKNQ